MAGKEEEFSAPMEPELKSVGSEAMSGCGKKRKAEETEEEAAVDVVVLGLPGSERMIRQDYSESEDDDEKVNEDEDPEVIFARIKAKFEARLRESDEEVTYEDDSEESDSDEDEETIYAKIKAKFDASTRELEALFPDQTYGDCFLEEDSQRG